MKVNLNEFVDSFFKGVILVLASSIATLGRYLVSPSRTTLAVHRGVKDPDIEQVTPRVLLFLVVAAALCGTYFLGRPLPNGGASVLDNLGPAIRSATEKRAGEVLFAAGLGGIIAVAAAHFYWSAVVPLLCPRGRRQKLAFLAMMLLTAAQVAVAVAIIVLIHTIGATPDGPFAIATGMPLMASHLGDPEVWSFFRPHELAVIVIVMVLSLAATLLPIAAGRMVAGPLGYRRDYRFLTKWHLRIAAVLVAATAGFIAAMGVAEGLYSTLLPPIEKLVKASLHNCRVTSDGSQTVLEADLMIDNRGAKAIFFEEQGLAVILSAEGRSMSAFLTVTPRAGSRMPQVIEPGSATLERVSATLSDAAASFAAQPNVQCHAGGLFGASLFFEASEPFEPVTVIKAP